MNKPMLLAAFTSILILPACASAPGAQSPSWLEPRCTISHATSLSQDIAMIDCGCGGVRIVTPASLIGHVSVKTAADAVAFVRFFSTGRSYRLFDTEGRVELMPVESGTPVDFNDVDRRAFIDHKLPFASAVESQIGEPGFLVTRTIVKSDQRVYELREFVGHRGDYKIVSETILLENAADIGVLHFGKI